MEICKQCGCLLLTEEEQKSGVCGACLPLKKLLCVQHVRVNADDLSDLRSVGVRLTRHPIHENDFRAVFPENTIRRDDGTYILPGNIGIVVEDDKLSIV